MLGVAMGRFLMFISYVGSAYSGIQRQVVAGVPIAHVRTIQGQLEKALSSFKLACDDVQLSISSRTDAGVHALCNGVKADLIPRPGAKEFEPLVITSTLNRMLMRWGDNIRVIRTIRVPDDFHCRRSAIARRYMYRLAIAKPGFEHVFGIPLSALEYSRCHTVIFPISLSKLEEAISLFSGTHDFRAFTSPSSLNEHSNTVKTMEIELRHSKPILAEHQLYITDNLDFLEFHFRSKSFLQKQIRRMMGIILAVAKDTVSLETLKDMLENPETHTYNLTHLCAPPHGLYLVDVEYNPEDLVYQPPLSTETSPTENDSTDDTNNNHEDTAPTTRKTCNKDLEYVSSAIISPDLKCGTAHLSELRFR